MNRLLDIGVAIQPPERNIYLRLIKASSFSPNRLGPDLGGGESIKPGNITVDIQRLLVAGAQTVRDIAATVKLPWLLPTTALILWDRLWSLLRIKITDKEACVIWVMWMNCDEDNTVPEAILAEKVNEERERYNHPKVSDHDLADALATLERMRRIQRSRNDHSKWWLREWVTIEYR